MLYVIAVPISAIWHSSSCNYYLIHNWILAIITSLSKLYIFDFTAFESQQSQLVKEQLKSLQQEMDEEEQRERERTEQSILALREEKSKILAERKQKIQEKASLLVGDEEEQKKLIKSHDENTQRLVNKIDAERLRMEADLNERLRKKREAKYKAKESEMQEELLKKRKEMEESDRQRRQQLAEEEKEKLEQLQKTLPYEFSSAAPQAENNSNQLLSDSTAPISPALPLKQQELTMLLLSSPLYQKLDEIAVLLQSTPLSGNNPSHYIDSKDALWVNDTEFHTVSTSSISPKAFVMYKFGCCIIKSLSAYCSHDPVSLLVADKIPPNRHIQQNAFCNSFMFDTKNRILYVRLERLENVGEFILVLVHILSHIQVGCFDNDTNPEFVKEFYRCLSFCCNDLFLSRYGDSSLGLQERDEIMKRSGMKTLVNDLLDTRLMVDTDSQGTTNKSHSYKLEKYAEFKFGSKLRAFLDEERQYNSNYNDQLHSSPHITTPNQVSAMTTSNQEVTAVQAATRSLNKASYWKTVAKRVLHQPSNPYHHILEAQTRDLQERVRKLNAEYMQVTKERNDVNAEVEKLEQVLAENQQKLKTINESEFEAQKQVVKNTALKLSAARTEQATYDLRVNGCLKRLEGFQAQLVQKQRMLEESVM